MNDAFIVGEEVVSSTNSTESAATKDFLAGLVGKTVEEAVKLVIGLGLKAREVNGGDLVSMDFDTKRVNLNLVDKLVASADVG